MSSTSGNSSSSSSGVGIICGNSTSSNRDRNETGSTEADEYLALAAAKNGENATLYQKILELRKENAELRERPVITSSSDPKSLIMLNDLRKEIEILKKINHELELQVDELKVEVLRARQCGGGTVGPGGLHSHISHLGAMRSCQSWSSLHESDELSYVHFRPQGSSTAASCCFAHGLNNTEGQSASTSDNLFHGRPIKRSRGESISPIPSKAPSADVSFVSTDESSQAKDPCTLSPESSDCNGMSPTFSSGRVSSGDDKGQGSCCGGCTGRPNPRTLPKLFLRDGSSSTGSSTVGFSTGSSGSGTGSIPSPRISGGVGSPISESLHVTTISVEPSVWVEPVPVAESNYVLVRLSTKLKKRYEHYVALITGERLDKARGGKKVLRVDYFKIKFGSGPDPSPSFSPNDNEKGMYEIDEDEIVARLPAPKVGTGRANIKHTFNFNFDRFQPLGKN